MKRAAKALRDQRIVDRFLSGMKESDISRRFRMTRERVRQILTKALGEEKKQEAMQYNREAPERQAVLEAKTPSGKECKVCTGPISVAREKRGGRGVTCSHRCAVLWKAGRALIDPEEYKRWRVTLAQSALRSPYRHARRSAQKVLGLPQEPCNPKRTAATKRTAPWKSNVKAARKRRSSAAIRAYDEAMRLRTVLLRRC